MKYRTFGTTAEQVSCLCLGTMMFGVRCDQEESDQILGVALDAGINFVDTAAMYCDGRTEEILGAICSGRRDKMFLTTKVHKGIDYDSIVGSMDESLQRLQMDHVDLFLIHWPKQGMDCVQIMRALNDVVERGKTRYVGCSNYPAWLYAHSNAIAAENGWAPLVCNQVPYNLIERGIEVEILPQAVAGKVVITTYRPLAIGLLTGKYRPGERLPEDSRGSGDHRLGDWLAEYGDGVSGFLGMAADLEVHPATLATAWNIGAPGVTSAIIGVSSRSQIDASIQAADFQLSAEQYADLTAVFDTEVKEVAGGDFVAFRREPALLKSDDA